MDASPSGENVFIRTASSLVASDPGQYDAYDARVNGGFAQPAPRPPCEGQACQSPPAAPEALTPASSAFHGAGNVTHKKHKHKRHHRRGRRHHGSAGR
jgi:hypothetical protein